jgi:hypothetical protein
VEAEILRQDGSANLLVKQMIVRPFFSCGLVEGIVKSPRPVNGSGCGETLPNRQVYHSGDSFRLALSQLKAETNQSMPAAKASKLRAVCVDVERAWIVAAPSLRSVLKTPRPASRDEAGRGVCTLVV